jgi:hypothetical protein
MTTSSLIYLTAFILIALLLPAIEGLCWWALKRELARRRSEADRRGRRLKRGYQLASWTVILTFFAVSFLWLTNRPPFFYAFMIVTGMMGLVYSFKGTLALWVLLTQWGPGQLRRLRKQQPASSTRPGADSASEPARRPISRDRFLTQAGLAVAAVPMLGVGHAIATGRYNFQVRRRSIRSRHLPAAFEGLRILQLSDFHTGSFGNSEAVAEGIELALAQQPDLICFTGDLVNNLAEELDGGYYELYRRLQAPLGVFACTGNHDYGDYVLQASSEERQRIRKAIWQAFRDCGFRLLHNEHVLLERQGASLALIGLGNWSKAPDRRYGDLAQATEGLADASFKLLLSHDPAAWEGIIRPHPLRFDLTLAGHTHGMQLGIDTEDFRWSPISAVYPQWADLYQAGEEQLYVNRGFGFSRFPGRLGVLPEITLFELQRA